MCISPPSPEVPSASSSPVSTPSPKVSSLSSSPHKTAASLPISSTRSGQWQGSFELANRIYMLEPEEVFSYISFRIVCICGQCLRVLRIIDFVALIWIIMRRNGKEQLQTRA
ncbi:hypothetical protein AAHE18_06G191000 [Arachis hypogaea]